VIKQPAMIVVADDDPSINTIIRMTLEYEGHHVLSYITSADAWQVAARVRPDLVITDMHMEARDAGWQLIDQLRADPTMAQVPVLFCSADIDMLTQRADELRQHGACVMIKPFAIDDLLPRVHQLLDRGSP